MTSASNRPRVSSSFKAQAQHDFTNKTHQFEDANSNEYGASLSPANGINTNFYRTVVESKA